MLEKMGLFIEYFKHAILSTFPLFSIALTGHCSWQTKHSSGHPFSSFSGLVMGGNEAVVMIPPSSNLGPYLELKSNPFFPIFPIPTASAILTRLIYHQKSPFPLLS